jgi:hypothetical protein
MKRFLPLLLTAFAGSLPYAKGVAPADFRVREAETPDDADRVCPKGRTAFKLWVDPRCAPIQRNLLRIQVELAQLSDDAVLQWGKLSESSPSRYARWEARRREMICRAWMSGRKASLFRLQRMENPYALSLREFHMEFEATGGDRA